MIQEQIELFSDNGTVAVIGDLNSRVGIETDFISGEAIDAQLQDKISFINYVNVTLNSKKDILKIRNHRIILVSGFYSYVCLRGYIFVMDDLVKIAEQLPLTIKTVVAQ